MGVGWVGTPLQRRFRLGGDSCGGEELRWRWRCSDLASSGSGFGDDCWCCGEVVVGADEVAVDIACLVFFDIRFSDHFSNLLRFAGLFLSR
ncbi:hypothetical protein QL285_078364 [Trifolium repens]|jgi:hypothetical protein|nr:hypothetical protein QL285_078364 [Trifolium repens]